MGLQVRRVRRWLPGWPQFGFPIIGTFVWLALHCATTLAISAQVPTPAIQVLPAIKTSFQQTGLNQPRAVALDTAGNAYVLYLSTFGVSAVYEAAGGNNSLNPVIVGSSTGDGGSSSYTQLSQAQDLKIDLAGNIYIADTYNHAVRVANTQTTPISVFGVTIQPGKILTVAGTFTSPGYSGDSGPAASAKLNQPSGIALDAAGNLYIADTGNHVIRRVNPSGTITTFSGQGPSSAGFSGDGLAAGNAKLNAPLSVAVDATGNLYIADSGNSRVRMVNNQAASLSALGQTIPAGAILTVAGNGTNSDSGDGSAATNAAIALPAGLSVTAGGNLILTDAPYNVVRQVDAISGSITRLAGNASAGYSGDGGSPASAQLNAPSGTAIGPDGAVYVADSANNAVRQIGLSSEAQPTSAPGNSHYTVLLQLNTALAIKSIVAMASLRPASENSQFFEVTGVSGCTVDNVTVNPAGSVCMAQVYFFPSYPGWQRQPLVVTDSSGNLYSIALNGLGLGPFPVLQPGSNIPMSGPSGLSGPVGVARDDGGNTYVADSGHHRVLRVDGYGNVTTFAGTGNAGYFGDGAAASGAQLNSPQGIALDGAGNLYIADYNNHRVRRVDANGTITSVAGNGSSGFSGDGGAATSAQVAYPAGVTVDPAGNLYVASAGRIREVLPASGAIISVAGTGSNGFSGDNGVAIQAQFNQPLDMAVDAGGNLYVADSQNCRVRKVAPSGRITTVAGSGVCGFAGDGGPAVNAELNVPQGVAVDPAGDLYIADGGNGSIRKVDLNGVVTTIAGTGQPASGGAASYSPATAGPLNNPSRLTREGGVLYVADAADNRIRTILLGGGTIVFPNTITGQTSPAQTLTLVNLGNQSDLFSSVSIPSYFSVNTANCPLPFHLAAGAACAIPATFQPGLGYKAGDLTFFDGSASPPGILLEGTGSPIPTSTAISSSSSGAVYGNSITLTAAVSANGSLIAGGPVVGGVSFVDTTTGVTLGTPALDYTGHASLTTTLPAGTHQIAASFAPNTNQPYATSSSTTTVVVSKAILTVTASNLTMTAGASLPVLTATVTGLVNGDTFAGSTNTFPAVNNGDTLSGAVAGTVSLSTAATPASAAGNYPITVAATLTAGANYSLSTVAGTLAVTTPTSFVVTTLTDSTAAGTLRTAILNANASSSLHAITFANGLTGVITLASALPQLTQSMSITGPGASSLAIDGAGAYQVFSVGAFGSAITVSISGVTIQNGSSANSIGGGIANNATLNLSSCTITGNQVKGLGIGGGIANQGTLTINECTVSNNFSSSPVQANQNKGGGLANLGGTATITNSTFYGNWVSDPSDKGAYGGAIYNQGTLLVMNSTIVGNSQKASNFSYGGGIAHLGSSQSLTLTNTIVAGNFDAGAYGCADVYGFSGFGGSNNLIGNSNCTNGIGNGVNGNQVGTAASPLDPQLGALAYNGGATPTMLPSVSSPVLGAGTTAGAAAADQRGFARVVNSKIDIGAVQFQGVGLAATAGTPQSATIGAAYAAPLTITATESCGTCSAVVPGVSVTFTAPSTGASGAFSNSASAITASTNSSGVIVEPFTANATVGGYNVTASATTPDQASPSSVNFALANNAFPPIRLVLGALPTTAGTAFSVTVTAMDPTNNVVTSYRGTVAFSKSDSGAGSSVPANYAFTAGDNGVHTFTNGVTLVTAGSQPVMVTDTITNTINGILTAIVNPAGAAHLAVGGPANAAAASAFSITVTALDAYNNMATAYRGTVQFTSSDSGPGKLLPVNYTFTAGDSGVHTFTSGVTLATPGSQTVTATDTVTNTIAGTSNAITVGPGAATHFSITGAPASIAAGTQFSVTVTALDADNNVATGYTGSLHFTSGDPGAVRPADSGLTNGAGTFSFTLNTSGVQTVVATDVATSSITGQTSVTVATPTSYVVTNTNASGTGSLAAQIAAANTDPNGGAITFNLPNPSTITIGGTLNISGSMSITGSGPSSVAIDGAGTYQVFSVGSGITASISGVTVQNGSTGIVNNGTLNLSSCTITGNQQTGGIRSVGSININRCTISNNASTTGVLNQGGGLLSDGPATITNSTFYGNWVTDPQNEVANGGAIFTGAPGRMTISNSTIVGNSQKATNGSSGGGIAAPAGSVTLTNTIVAGNTDAGTSNYPDAFGLISGSYNLIGNSNGGFGGITNGVNGNQVGTVASPLNPQLGALANNGGPTQTMLPNGNSPALGAGSTTGAPATDQRGFARVVNGKIDIGAVQLQGVTISATSGTPQSAVVGTPFATPLTVTATENTSGSAVPGVPVTFTAPTLTPSGTFSNGAQTITASTNSSGLVGEAFTAANITTVPSGYNVTASATTPDQAAPSTATFALTNTGGPATQLVLALPQKVAAGSTFSFGVAAVDQNGITSSSYVGTVHFTISDNAAGAVVPADFTFPPNYFGATTFLARLETFGTQTITVTDTANPSITGQGTVVVATPTSYLVTNTNASGVGSLAAAVAAANADQAGGAITFNLPNPSTIVVHPTLGLTQSMSITGPGAQALAIDGSGFYQIMQVDAGATVSISGLTIQNGSNAGSTSGGAGIQNFGVLNLSSCAITGNQSTVLKGAAGISNTGTLTVNQCTISNNTTIHADQVGGATLGGGLLNSGSATITNSTFYGNTISVSRTTPGGGIYNTASGTVTINNSTIANNGNGIFNNGGNVTLVNTILAGNGSDALGAFSGSNNLIGVSDGSSGIANGTNGNIAGTSASPMNPMLGSLANNGGPTQTMLPSVAGPVIGAGSVAGAPATDQRGFARVVNGKIDIGAVEFQGLTLGSSSGAGQSTAVNTAFPNPLQATWTETGSNVPLAGQTVTYSAPTSGASATVASSVVTNSSGVSSSTATANAIAGSYNVTATLGGVTATFALTNGGGSATTTNLTANPSSGVVYGGLVTLSVTVSSSGGTPAGTVTFVDTTTATTLSSNAALNGSGQASVSVTTLTAVPHVITATYNPSSGAFQTSNGQLSNFTVAKAPLTVTANNLTMTVGATLPVLTATISGLVNSERFTGSTSTFPTVNNGNTLSGAVTGTVSLATTATPSAAPGTYPITAGSGGLGLSASNYTIAFTPGTLTVTTIGPAFSAIALNFGNVAMGSSSATQTVTATNSGAYALTVTNVAASGDFSQTNNCATVAASGTCTIVVTFTPTTTGSRTGAIAITDNAATSPQAIRLSGVGISGSAGARVSLSSIALNFGSQSLGTTSAPLPVVLTNSGDTALTVNSITVMGDFVQTNNCGVVAPAATCTISVTFTPTATGMRQGSVAISGSAAGSPHLIRLSGIGISAPAPAIGLSKTSLNFGNQTTGTPSSAQTLTVTNTGTATLTITGVAATGDFAASGCVSSLAAGASCTLSVTFTPTAAGSRRGSVMLTDNAAGSPQVISLFGNGM
jgi:hypothetical protein